MSLFRLTITTTYMNQFLGVRPMLSHCCLSVLFRLSARSVCDVTIGYCSQTVGAIKIKLGMEVGLVPGHIVLDGDPAPPQGGTAAPHFSAHVYCGQTAGGSRCHLVQVGRKIGLGPGHIVLDGNPCSSPKEKRGTPPFSAHVYGQTDRWIKIPLGTKKASARGHIVLNWVI